jgi:hypothetical protein
MKLLKIIIIIFLIYILFNYNIKEPFITANDIYNQDTPDLFLQLAKKRIPGGRKIPHSPNFITGTIVTNNFIKNIPKKKYQFKLWDVKKQTKLYAPW